MTPAPGLALDPPFLGLAGYLGYLAVARFMELIISARHARILRERGAVEHGRGHFPLLVALHVVFPLALAAEVAWGGARPGPTWWIWLALLAAALALRLAAIRALGVYWNVRILVVAGLSPIRRGPYRTLRHPNYVAVVVELLAGPMMFGAWRTALAVSALNVLILGIRIRAEERALEWAAVIPSRPFPPSGSAVPPLPRVRAPSEPPT